MSLPSPLAEPRSFFGIALRLAALVYVPLAAVLTTGLLLFGELFGWDEAFCLVAGPGMAVGGSLLFGLMNATALRAVTRMVPASDARAVLAQINLAAARLGFTPVWGADGFHVYQPAFLTGWAAGTLAVQFHDQFAAVVGPRVFVTRLLATLPAEESRD